jgi:hypothetical protein
MPSETSSTSSRDLFFHAHSSTRYPSNKNIGLCVQLYDLSTIYKNAPVVLSAQCICAPPQLVITGTDHLTIHPVGYHVEGQSTHHILKLLVCVCVCVCVCIYIVSGFSRGGDTEMECSEARKQTQNNKYLGANKRQQ